MSACGRCFQVFDGDGVPGHVCWNAKPPQPPRQPYQIVPRQIEYIDLDSQIAAQRQVNEDRRLEAEVLDGVPPTLAHIAALNRLDIARLRLRANGVHPDYPPGMRGSPAYQKLLNHTLAQFEIDAEYQRALDRIVVESLIRSTPGVKL